MIPGRLLPERRETAEPVGFCICGVGGTRESHRQRIVECRNRMAALAGLKDCQSTLDTLVAYRCKVERCMAVDTARRAALVVA